MEYEKIEKIISFLWGKKIQKDDEFSREFEFEVEGEKYNIVWFYNLSTLQNGWMFLFFEDCEISNTYPVWESSKNKIQFLYWKNTVWAIIIDRYK